MKVIKPKKRISKWRPMCASCQYMKTHKDFRVQLFESSFFIKGAPNSPLDVDKAYGLPIKREALYTCIKRHHQQESINAPVQVIDGKTIVDNRFKQTFSVIENVNTSNAELGLEEFIKQGRDKLARGEMQITATTFVAALGKRMDIDAKTKDRRADMLSGLFRGAAPKQDI